MASKENEVKKTNVDSTSTKKNKNTVKPTPTAKKESTENASKEDADFRITPKEVDLNQVIPVLNGFHGRLIYISKRTGEKFEWEEFGDDQDIELKELRNAKSASKEFFENNWFMFRDEDAWVIEYLGLNKMYQNSIRIEDFDDVFRQKPDEIKSIVSEMPEGQKNSLSYRARQLVAEKKIDSLSVIKALEEALGIELIER